MSDFEKLKIKEYKQQTIDMRKEVEKEAFFFKIVILTILIVSVGMLIFSYKIDHGEIIEPLKK